MSRAKPRHPGDFYLITRRCHRREYRLTPSPALNAAIAVLVVAACLATGVEIIAMVWMPNHYHAVLYDPEGRVSEWLARVHGLLARFCNAEHETESHVWDASENNDEPLEGMDAIVAATAYCLANPVAAGLVYSPRAWPGIVTQVEELGTGEARLFRRPEAFFREDGPVPEWGAIISSCPPGIAPEEFRARVKARLETLLAKARARVAESGLGFVGIQRVLERDVFDSPATAEAPNPAARSRRYRARANLSKRRQERAERDADFRSRYAEALHELQNQVPDVLFPAGTFKVWRYFGARREPPIQPSAAP